MVWFRIALSAYGKGHVLVLFEDPTRAAAWPELANFCICDNEPLARYLVEGFCKKFGVFREAKAFSTLEYLPMQQQIASGDNVSSSAVTVSAQGLKVELIWDKLGKPFAADIASRTIRDGRAREIVSAVCLSQRGCVDCRQWPQAAPGGPFLVRSWDVRASSAFLAFFRDVAEGVMHKLTASDAHARILPGELTSLSPGLAVPVARGRPGLPSACN
jgi:hypothetical protein